MYFHKLGHLPVSNIWECTEDEQQRITKTIFYPFLSTAYKNNNLPQLLVTFNSFNRCMSQCINSSLSPFSFIQCGIGKLHSFVLYSVAPDVLFFNSAWLHRIKTFSFRSQLIKAEYHWMAHSSRTVEVPWQTRVSNNSWY